MSRMNRMGNAKNGYQGSYKKVLLICSAGILRSPTAALVLSMPPFNFNTRAAGIDPDFALIVVDEFLLHWADEVVCMSPKQAHQLKNDFGYDNPIVCLNIDDDYVYRDPVLMALIKERYEQAQA